MRAFSTEQGKPEAEMEEAIDAKQELEAVRDEEAAKKGSTPDTVIPESHEKVTGMNNDNKQTKS